MTEKDMPPKVAKACADVMGVVPKLAKGEKNSHGNYNFASIDDFLEAVRPLMAAKGLVISSDEDDFEVVDKWLRIRFAFYAHCEGESYGPMRRSVMVLSSMGAQAFGAAQSYAEKNFLRSLFKIATGEGAAIDADSHPQQELAQTRQRPAPLKGKHKTRAALREAAGLVAKKLSEAADGGDASFIDAVISEYKDDIDQIKNEGPADWWSNPDWGMDAKIAEAYGRVPQKDDQ